MTWIKDEMIRQDILELKERKGAPAMENNEGTDRTVFQMNIDSHMRETLENLYAKRGMTLAQAVDAFFKQSIQAGGLPFSTAEKRGKNFYGEVASQLELELKKGENSVNFGKGWIEEKEILEEFGVSL